jgi:hypothetical protein
VGFGWRKGMGMGMGGRETGHGWVWMDSLTINPGDGGLWLLRKGHGAGFLFFLLFFSFFSVYGFVVFGFGPRTLAVTPSHGASGTRGSGIGNGTEKLWALVLLDHHDLSSRNSKTVLSRESWETTGYARRNMAFAGIPGALSFSFLSRLSLSVSPWIYFPFSTRQTGTQLLCLAPFSTFNAAVPFPFLFLSFPPHQPSPLDGWHGVPCPPRSRSCAVR